MTTQQQNYTIDITLADENDHGVLANAELYLAGDLAGIALVGFTVWEGKDGKGPNVTFPARQYMKAGKKQTFSFVRAVTRADGKAMAKLRQMVLDAYDQANREALVDAGLDPDRAARE